MKREFEYIKTLICDVFEDDVFKGEVYIHRESQCDKCTGVCRAYTEVRMLWRVYSEPEPLALSLLVRRVRTLVFCFPVLTHCGLKKT